MRLRDGRIESEERPWNRIPVLARARRRGRAWPWCRCASSAAGLPARRRRAAPRGEGGLGPRLERRARAAARGDDGQPPRLARAARARPPRGGRGRARRSCCSRWSCSSWRSCLPAAFLAAPPRGLGARARRSRRSSTRGYRRPLRLTGRPFVLSAALCSWSSACGSSRETGRPSRMAAAPGAAASCSPPSSGSWPGCIPSWHLFLLPVAACLLAGRFRLGGDAPGGRARPGRPPGRHPARQPARVRRRRASCTRSSRFGTPAPPRARSRSSSCPATGRRCCVLGAVALLLWRGAARPVVARRGERPRLRARARSAGCSAGSSSASGPTGGPSPSWCGWRSRSRPHSSS